jgi:hypothetical protein
MRGWVVVYQLPTGMTNSQRVTFHYKFYGATTTSHAGKYRSHRRGLLEAIPHRRLASSVILATKVDGPTIERFLRDSGATVWSREVILADDDLAFLRRPGAG